MTVWCFFCMKHVPCNPNNGTPYCGHPDPRPK